MTSYYMEWCVCPKDSTCTNVSCKAPIFTGDICGKFLHSEGYGCHICVVKYEYSAWGPVKGELSAGLPPIKDKSMVKITLTSFACKKGLPSNTSIPPTQTFDVRKSIRNPWKDPILRKLTGLDERVQKYILICPKTAIVLDRIILYIGCGYNVNVGCYGGKHRSVAIVEIAAAKLRADGYSVEVIHRDLKVK